MNSLRLFMPNLCAEFTQVRFIASAWKHAPIPASRLFHIPSTGSIVPLATAVDLLTRHAVKTPSDGSSSTSAPTDTKSSVATDEMSSGWWSSFPTVSPFGNMLALLYSGTYSSVCHGISVFRCQFFFVFLFFLFFDFLFCSLLNLPCRHLSSFLYLLS